jgi:MFS family permease
VQLDRSAAAGRSVLAGAVANLAVGTLFAWSLVAEEATAGVGAGRGFAGVVFASAIAVFAVVLLVAGRAPAWLCPRRLLLAAAVAGSGGLLLAASAGGPVALWCGVALLFGAANGLAYGVAISLATHSPRRRGTATGVVVAAYAAGPVVLGLVTPAALGAAGWRACLAGLGCAVAVLLLAAALLAPDRPGRRGERGGTDGRPPARVVVLLWLVFAGGTAPALLLFAYAVPVAEQSRLDAGAAGLAVSALAAGNLAGRLGAGWWSDRIGRSRALAVALVAAALSIGALAVPAHVVLVAAGFLGTGLAYGAVSSLVPAATADRVPADAFSRAYGRVFTAWGCAGLLAPLAGDAVVGLQEDHPALLGLAALPLVPAVVALVLLTRQPIAAGRILPRT